MQAAAVQDVPVPGAPRLHLLPHPLRPDGLHGAPQIPGDRQEIFCFNLSVFTGCFFPQFTAAYRMHFGDQLILARECTVTSIGWQFSKRPIADYCTVICQFHIITANITIS